MKKPSILILAVFFGTQTFAQSVKAPEDPVMSQIHVTASFTKMMNEKINREVSDAQLHSSDYKAFQKTFQGQLNTVFEKFENDVQTQVFAPISLMKKRYDALVNSPYSSEAALSQQYEVIKQKMEEYSKIYQGLIAPLYHNPGDLAFDFRAQITDELDGSRGCHYSKQAKKVVQKKANSVALATVTFSVLTQSGTETMIDQYCAKIINDGYNFSRIVRVGEINGPEIDVADLNKPTIALNYDGNITPLQNLLKNRDLLTLTFQKVSYPNYRKVCTTQLCLSLLTAEYTYFFDALSKEVDHDQIFVLADKKQIKLTALNQFHWDNDYYKSYASQRYTPQWWLLFGMLTATSYPTEYKSLDYDTAN